MKKQEKSYSGISSGEYRKKEKKNYKLKGPLRVLLWILLIITGFAAGVLVLVSTEMFSAADSAKELTGQQQAGSQYAIWFDGTGQAETLQYLDVGQISEPFFPDMDTDETFFFAGDYNGYYFVVSRNDMEWIWNDITGDLDVYEDYFYGDTLEEPEPLRIVGVPVKINQEIKKEAVDRWNYIWDEEFLTVDNFEEYFGSYYLQILPFGAGSISQLTRFAWKCIGAGILLWLLMAVLLWLLFGKNAYESNENSFIFG